MKMSETNIDQEENYNKNKVLQNNYNSLFLTSAIYMKHYNKYNIILLEPIKNSIIERSKFIKIVYSDSLVSMNGIFIYLSFKDITYIFDSNNSNLNNNYRYKIYIDKNKNRDTIDFIKKIEYDIFDKLSNNKKYENKIFNYKLNEQMNNNFIKCTSNSDNCNKIIERDNKFILKISGICETEYEYNITYKFIELNNNNILI